MLIKALKLVSGEEIVAEIAHEEDGVIVIKNALVIAIQRNPDGNLGIGFIPFAPYLPKDTSIEIKADKTTFCVEVDDQMKNQYNVIFGGIVAPPKNIITV